MRKLLLGVLLLAVGAVGAGVLVLRPGLIRLAAEVNGALNGAPR
jgi:hypothetical protein